MRGPNPAAGTASSHWRDRPATCCTGAVAPEEVEMRRAIAVMCSTALLLTALAPAVVAASPSPAAPIRGVVVDMATYGPCPIDSAQPVVDPSGCWFGHVAGDVPGRIAFWEDPPGYGNPKAAAWHFFEKFTFLPDTGGWFAGYNVGHWARFSGFRASGLVTMASPEWAALIGHRYYERGVTICDDVGCTAYGTELFMAKAGGDPWP